MERSVFSLFQSEYRSEVEQSGPELLPVIPPASSPVDGKLSDNLRFVSDFVHGKMDTALPGEAGDVRQSAVAEGKYVYIHTYVHVLYGNECACVCLCACVCTWALWGVLSNLTHPLST